MLESLYNGMSCLLVCHDILNEILIYQTCYDKLNIYATTRFNSFTKKKKCLSVINILMDLQTDKACQKTNYPLYFIGISISKVNISPT